MNFEDYDDEGFFADDFSDEEDEIEEPSAAAVAIKAAKKHALNKSLDYMEKRGTDVSEFRPPQAKVKPAEEEEEAVAEEEEVVAEEEAAPQPEPVPVQEEPPYEAPFGSQSATMDIIFAIVSGILLMLVIYLMVRNKKNKKSSSQRSTRSPSETETMSENTFQQLGGYGMASFIQSGGAIGTPIYLVIAMLLGCSVFFFAYRAILKRKCLSDPSPNKCQLEEYLEMVGYGCYVLLLMGGGIIMYGFLS